MLTWMIKGTDDKLNFIKILKFGFSKDTIKIMKRESTIWKIMFTNHIPDKEHISRTYKEFSEFNTKETKN